MKEKVFLYIIATLIFTIGCSSNRRPEGGLACVDVRKNYPVKEINLNDIADVSYVHLNTENKDYLYKGGIVYKSEKIIVIRDDTSGSILFFSNKGNPKSRFNRYGTGPEEYSSMTSTIIYDESVDDLFVFTHEKILAYSSTGEHKRTLTLPKGISADQVVDFDDLSLLAYDSNILLKKTRKQSDVKPFSTHYRDSSFFLISKTDGKVLDYVVLPNNEIDLSYSLRGGLIRTVPLYNRVVRCAEGALLFNHETDTIFLYGKDKSLIPIICKKPLVRELDPAVILDEFIDIGKFQLMKVETLCEDNGSKGKYPPKYYVRDKKTGEIFNQKMMLSDYKGREVIITARNMRFDGKEALAIFEFDLFELKQAYNENKLSGNLKELVSILDENEDNNVFMFVNFI